MHPLKNILVIRRDNIGDLVLTTPLLASLKQAFPHASVSVLVNTYNRTVLVGNPDVDQLYVYEKAKHRTEGVSRTAVWWRTLRLILTMRRRRFDVAILAGAGHTYQAEKFARLVGARHIVGYLPKAGAQHHVDLPVEPNPTRKHHAEVTHELIKVLGVRHQAGPARVVPQEPLQRLAMQRLAELDGKGPVVALHISSRKPSQRWPAERFVQLMDALLKQAPFRFMLFWSPGEEDNPVHPGDNAKAQSILDASRHLPVLACPTAELAQLIAQLSVCDYVVCSDGGALHIAAGLAKPIVCFFGDSDPEHWGPWAVPHRLLQPASRQVADISVQEVRAAFVALCQEVNSTALSPIN
jgi:ADP-heptose:LPS heptosyltransferase